MAIGRNSTIFIYIYKLDAFLNDDVQNNIFMNKRKMIIIIEQLINGVWRYIKTKRLSINYYIQSTIYL